VREEVTQEKTMRIPIQVEAFDADALPCINSSRVNEVEPRPEDAPGGDASPRVLKYCGLRGQ
jgi:hypothetical protein